MAAHAWRWTRSTVPHGVPTPARHGGCRCTWTAPPRGWTASCRCAPRRCAPSRCSSTATSGERRAHCVLGVVHLFGHLGGAGARLQGAARRAGEPGGASGRPGHPWGQQLPWCACVAASRARRGLWARGRRGARRKEGACPWARTAARRALLARRGHATMRDGAADAHAAALHRWDKSQAHSTLRDVHARYPMVTLELGARRLVWCTARS